MQVSQRQARRRPPRACVQCRRRKIKCDRSQPCSQCVLSICPCLYDSRIRGPSRIVGSFPGASVGVPGGHQAGDAGLNRTQCPSAEIPDPSPTAAVTNNHGSHGHSSPGRSFDDEGKPATVGAISGLASSRANGDDDGPLVLNKSRLFGQTHWSNAVQEFKKIAAFMRNEAGSTGAINSTTAPATISVQQVQALQQQCKTLSRNLKRTRPGRLLSRPRPIVPTRGAAEHLARLYFSCLESVFRILHRPSFWYEWEYYWADPTTSTDVMAIKVQLVIALGSGLAGDGTLFSPQTLRDVHKVACEWVFAVQDWLSAPFEKDRLSLDCVQIQCLLVLARQVLSVGSDVCWVSMGTLLRCAIQLGLHRDPAHFPSLTIREAELRRRLWATIMELNIQTSLDCGTPPGISVSDFDSAPPSNVDDRDLRATVGTLESRPDDVFTETSLQILLLRNLPDRLRMLQCMNDIGNPLTDTEILTLSARISAACRECVEYCHKPKTGSSETCDNNHKLNEDADTTGFEQAMTQFLLRRFLLVMHRPLAGRINENALYYHSRKVSFDTASALLIPADCITNSGGASAWAQLMVRGGGMFRSCLIHVSLALASETLIEIGEFNDNDNPAYGRTRHLASTGGSLAYRRLLKDSVREARDLWAERIKRGETNVRSHMKLSIVLGLVEDKEKGDSRNEVGGTWTQQQRMASSAKESLETCLDLIQRYYSDSQFIGDVGCGSATEDLDLSSYPLDLAFDVFQASNPGGGNAFLLFG